MSLSLTGHFLALVSLAIIVISVESGRKSRKDAATVFQIKSCNSLDQEVKHGFWELDGGSGETIRVWCQKGFKLRWKKDRPRVLDCRSNGSVGLWPRCVAKKKRQRSPSSKILSLMMRHQAASSDIQADEAQKSASHQTLETSEDIPEHWIPYGDDIVGHGSGDHADDNEDDDEILILATQDGDKIRETGKYEPVRENQDSDQTYDGSDDYSDEEEDEEYDDYDGYEEDYGKQSGDYGQYYDYDYEDKDKDSEDVPEAVEASGDFEDIDAIDPPPSDEILNLVADKSEISDKILPLEADQQETSADVGPGSVAIEEEAEDSTPGTNEALEPTNEGVNEDYNDSDDYEEQYEDPKGEKGDEEKDYEKEEEKDYEKEEEKDYDKEEEEEEALEQSRIENEEEILYRNYEILSDFYKKHFVDLRVLDTSCDPKAVPPPPIANGGVQEYQTVENVLLPGKQYHEVVYGCDPGFKFSESSLGHMFCQQQGWMGVQPYCEEDPNAQQSPAHNRLKDCDPNHGCEHSCSLVDGTPKCSCNEGYQPLGDTSCMDIDECADANGGCIHECINKPGTYTCECPKGFSPSGSDCLDINECVANNGHGPCQDTCINNEGGYECTCEGLPGTELQEDGHKCSGVDLCADNNGGCSHECYTTYGQSFCMCPSGFKLDEDWKTCVDVDECATMSTVRKSCPNGCENTIGSFKCVEVSEMESVETQTLCNPGYAFDDTLNESEYTCDCVLGFRFDGQTCVDVDECAKDPCGKNGECVNGDASYSCECSPGFSFDGETCVDINECAEDEERCDQGTCLNSEGSFECDCAKGYEFRAGSCFDVDECQSNICQNGECSNWDGSFDCNCNEGFQWSEETKQCEDIDECEHRMCGRAQCDNSIGSFKCSCRGNRVYSVALRRCQRLNPCKQNPELCGAHGYCEMVRNGFECHCDPGFQSNGTVCLDVDECATDQGGCDHECKNSQGSFQCSCQIGYQINPNDPQSCIDVDECSELEDSCLQNCINTDGSYRCTCSEGYQKDPEEPSNCLVVPTCAQECSHQCQEGVCACPESMVLGMDEATCIPEAPPKLNGCAPMKAEEGMSIQCSESPNQGAYGKGTICRGKCTTGFIPFGRLKQKCRKDGSWSGSNGTCQQVFCPPLPLGSQVQVMPETCSTQDVLVRQRCKFSCQEGFNLVGSRSTRCRRNQTWKYNGGPPKCINAKRGPNELEFTTPKVTQPKSIGNYYEEYQPTSTPSYRQPTSTPSYTQPYIYCPPDISRDLPSDSATLYVRIPQPKTNVNWYDFVKSTPDWAKNLEGQLPLGKTLITFQALSPVTDESTSCSFTVHVKDTVPPRVYNCPNDFNVYLDEGQTKRQVFWEEPIFADNVKIKHVMASKMPGQLLGEGKHDVLYQASDDDSNQAKCRFTIKVYPAQQLEIRKRKWVICRVGTTGRLIKLFVSHVPRGCWVLPRYKE
eukprot:maker-scaffold105_size367834-snap-gene-2.37 protein:Tk10187 transcript:maker-scaffold105_size367834-snap-gene-2.37-mRNA-1 annotation:"hypothetical protein DAPPUDRAFT_303147"